MLPKKDKIISREPSIAWRHLPPAMRCYQDVAMRVTYIRRHVGDIWPPAGDAPTIQSPFLLCDSCLRSDAFGRGSQWLATSTLESGCVELHDFSDRNGCLPVNDRARSIFRAASLPQLDSARPSLPRNSSVDRTLKTPGRH